MRTSLVLLALLASACNDDPADFRGDYTIALTNGDNGCGFANWTEGDTATGVQFTITQEGSAITGIIGGGTGWWATVVLGDDTFTGTVDGDSTTMTLYGTNSAQQSGCTYTVNATMNGDLDGDYLSGTIDYRASTNGSPDCGTLENCLTRQMFNGTRPPSR